MQACPDAGVDDLGAEVVGLCEVADGVEVARGPVGSNPWMSSSNRFVPRNCAEHLGHGGVSVPCADGYSGWLGVARSGRQPGCSTVAGFPSSKPGTGPKPSAVTAVGSIAVTGRQNR